MRSKDTRKQQIREARKDGNFLIAVTIGIPIFIILIYVFIYMR
jgi:hypothetical protein